MAHTNFQKVSQFNNTFGVEKLKHFDENAFSNKKLLQLRMNLIREEMRELEDAVRTNDRKETIDALSDILYVVYGMGDCLGINLDRSFSIVHHSNMSKLADTEEIAKESVDRYKQNPNCPYDTPNYRPIQTNNGIKYLIYNESTGKVLKSKNYTRANFDELLNIQNSHEIPSKNKNIE